jgi:hypothetical protein
MLNPKRIGSLTMRMIIKGVIRNKVIHQELLVVSNTVATLTLSDNDEPE